MQSHHFGKHQRVTLPKHLSSASEGQAGAQEEVACRRDAKCSAMPFVSKRVRGRQYGAGHAAAPAGAGSCRALAPVRLTWRPGRSLSRVREDASSDARYSGATSPGHVRACFGRRHQHSVDQGLYHCVLARQHHRSQGHACTQTGVAQLPAHQVRYKWSLPDQVRPFHHGHAAHRETRIYGTRAGAHAACALMK